MKHKKCKKRDKSGYCLYYTKDSQKPIKCSSVDFKCDFEYK